MHIKYILTHPIQYQSPLIKYLTKKGIKITVLYRSDFSTKEYFDTQFKKKIKWDIDLLKGYNYKFLNYIGSNKVTTFLPLTTDFYKNIFTDTTKIIWIHGIKNWYNLTIIILAKFTNKKIFVRDESHLLNRGMQKKRGFLNKLFNLFLFKFIDNFIDAYLAIGSINKKFYLSNGIKKDKIFYVPYTVDNNLFYKKKKIKKNKKIIFLYAGKFTRNKGADLLLKAIYKLNKKKLFLSNTKFIFIGDGEIKNESVEFVKKNKLTNVKFFPFQKKYKDLIKFYHSSDVFILPSRFENWGMTINEAMAAENAIICSEQCGASYDLVKNSVNGYTFKNSDADDLSNKINLVFKFRNRINYLKKNSLKLILKWNFDRCYNGLNKAINYVSKNN
jgi:glycosyltransferase involved in cell wall biosynthesis